MSATLNDPRIAAGMRRQFELRKQRLDSGAKQIGWKVGLGAPAALERCKLTKPVVGFLLDRAQLDSGTAVSLKGWTKPVAEIEIAAYIARDLPANADDATVRAAIGALGGYVLRRTAESVVLASRRGLLSHLLRLRLSAVERHEPGDLMSRVTADTTLLREVTIGTLVGGITGILTLTATVVLMALLDVVMLAVTVVALGLAVVVIGLVVPRINRASRQAQESVGLIGAALARWAD